MKSKTIKIVEVSDFDELVKNTYGIPYNFQQQSGCKSKGTEYFNFPLDGNDYTNTEIPFKLDGEMEGINFEVWRNHDKEEFKKHFETGWELELFYERVFYPHIEMVIQDLAGKGLIEEEDFAIEIDW